jgi:integrase
MRRDGRYVARWREGGRHRSRTFLLAGDRDAFLLDVKRRKQLGSLAPSVMQSRLTLAEFVESDWWPRYALPSLKDSTRRRYLQTWGRHLLGSLGDYELRALTPMLIEDWREQMARRGVSLQEQRRAMILAQGILRRAVARGLIPVNPAQLAQKPRQAPLRRPEPLSPATIEAIRAQMGQRDAALVSLLAYAGLRPGEATSARWKDMGERTLHVHASKTERPRTVRLLSPLLQDLLAWRLASPFSGERDLIFPNRDGDKWVTHDAQNWRRRVYVPAAKAAGVTDDLRVYRLRGSFVSLLLAEGRTLIYVARQAGHSVATMATHYAGVIEDLSDVADVSAEQAIHNARELEVRLVHGEFGG